MEDDTDKRLQFSEIMLNIIEEDQTILDNIPWTDEASFKLFGHVYRHTCVCWYSENKHLTIEQQQNQSGVNTWGGISSSGAIGAIFFDATVTGDNYLKIIKNQIVPQLQQQSYSNDFYFQQDDVPRPHSRQIQEYLDEAFSEKWISRKGPIDWTARSHDVTVMVFFWGGSIEGISLLLKTKKCR